MHLNIDLEDGLLANAEVEVLLRLVDFAKVLVEGEAFLDDQVDSEIVEYCKHFGDKLKGFVLLIVAFQIKVLEDVHEELDEIEGCRKVLIRSLIMEQVLE